MIWLITYRCLQCGAVIGRALEAERGKWYLGKEIVVCKCGAQARTRYREWAHLLAKERWGYFVSEGVIAACLLFPIIGAIVSVLVNRESARIGISWGILAALAAVVVMWLAKAVKVWASLRRCPEVIAEQKSFR